jgi:hypothetical protein
MIKFTLPNGIKVECDTATEAAQMIALYDNGSVTLLDNSGYCLKKNCHVPDHCSACGTHHGGMC